MTSLSSRRRSSSRSGKPDGLINGVANSFLSVLVNGSVMLNWDVRTVGFQAGYSVKIKIHQQKGLFTLYQLNSALKSRFLETSEVRNNRMR